MRKARTHLACILTRRSFAMGFTSIAKPSRSRFSLAQALFPGPSPNAWRTATKPAANRQGTSTKNTGT